MHTQTVLNLYKPLGWTPLEVIKKFKNNRPEYKSLPMTYAGRLDPMAEGVLMVLAGEGIFQKHEVMRLPKTYLAKVLFGFSTDSYDLLGLVGNTTLAQIDYKALEAVVENFVGQLRLPVPPYSSVPVLGKPIFDWAKRNLLSEIKIPFSETRIFKFKIKELTYIKKADIEKQIFVIGILKGDFRQEEILKYWAKVLKAFKTTQVFPLATIQISCSSGTYVRSIAHELGKKLRVPACLFHLLRLSVGKFMVQNSAHL